MQNQRMPRVRVQKEALLLLADNNIMMITARRLNDRKEERRRKTAVNEMQKGRAEQDEKKGDEDSPEG